MTLLLVSSASASQFLQRVISKVADKHPSLYDQVSAVTKVEQPSGWLNGCLQAISNRDFSQLTELKTVCETLLTRSQAWLNNDDVFPTVCTVVVLLSLLPGFLLSSSGTGRILSEILSVVQLGILSTQCSLPKPWMMPALWLCYAGCKLCLPTQGPMQKLLSRGGGGEVATPRRLEEFSMLNNNKNTVSFGRPPATTTTFLDRTACRTLEGARSSVPVSMFLRPRRRRPETLLQKVQRKATSRTFWAGVYQALQHQTEEASVVVLE